NRSPGIAAKLIFWHKRPGFTATLMPPSPLPSPLNRFQLHRRSRRRDNGLSGGGEITDALVRENSLVAIIAHGLEQAGPSARQVRPANAGRTSRPAFDLDDLAVRLDSVVEEEIAGGILEPFVEAAASDRRWRRH